MAINITIPRIMFASSQSGCGKTVITCAFLNILKRRGIPAVSFKCGPDYIDPLFHKYVQKIPGYNLDSFFLPEEEIRSLFVKKAYYPLHRQIAVTEGVMGYYDGIGGNSLKASTYDIARITDTPVILILDAKKAGLSLAAELKGFMEYLPQSHIKGVILNRTTKAMAELLRPALEETGAVFLGFVPVCEEAELKSRHLGLTLPKEQEKLSEKLDALADILEESLDTEKIIELAQNAAPLTFDLEYDSKKDEAGHLKGENKPPSGRIAFALDEAFCFYYQDNLDFLQESGYELVPFSPLHGDKLPPDCKAILLGGGYPEIFARELSENTAMLKAMRAAFGKVKIIAECGGFMYLHKTLEDVNGDIYPLCGCIDADAYRTDKLLRFGYITLDDSIKAHEFHYWESTAPGHAFTACKPESLKKWDCMYHTPTLLAGFPHLYYRSNPLFILDFLREETH